MMPDHLPKNYLLVAKASIEAAEAVMAVYASDIKVNIKEDYSPVTSADIRSSEIITLALLETGIPIIDEETTNQDFNQRTKWDENWCVDPLDGTKMFIQKNDEFSINIAHIVNSKPVFGIINSPVEKRIILGGAAFGVFILSYEDLFNPHNWNPLTIPQRNLSELKVICSRSFDESNQRFFESNWAKGNRITYIKKGSALKFFDLALGQADIYPRFAPTMEWDIAAGQAILEALQGEVVDCVSMLPLSYNKENLYNPPFIARMKSTI